MSVEEVGEAISVVASFSGGKARPVRFRWGSRTYRIDAVNGQWVDRSGDAYSLHYSVQAGQETFYIHFEAGEVQWWLDRVILEG